MNSVSSINDMEWHSLSTNSVIVDGAVSFCVVSSLEGACAACVVKLWLFVDASFDELDTLALLIALVHHWCSFSGKILVLFKASAASCSDLDTRRSATMMRSSR